MCSCVASILPPSPAFLPLQSKAGVPPIEDQEKLLSEALNQVKKNSFEMKTCLVSLAVAIATSYAVATSPSQHRVQSSTVTKCNQTVNAPVTVDHKELKMTEIS